MPLLPEKEKRLPDATGWWARKNIYDSAKTEWFFVEKVTLPGADESSLCIWSYERMSFHPVESYNAVRTYWFGPIELPWDDT